MSIYGGSAHSLENSNCFVLLLVNFATRNSVLVKSGDSSGSFKVLRSAY